VQQTALATRSIPGIDDKLRTRLVNRLNQNLASLTDMAAAYKQAHWAIVGIDFSQLHELFDEFTDQIRTYMDDVAERAVMIGGVAHGTIQAATERTTLPPFPLDERDELRLLEALVVRIDKLDEDLRHAMHESADDPATQDVYIETVRGVEKQRWMLQSHLDGKPHGDGAKP
jgi:starvation-inducible DNA-binding protein